MKIKLVHGRPGIAAAFGYTTFLSNLMKALTDKGVELDDASPVAVHLMPPYFFRLVRFKKNVLFSMFEFDNIPRQWHSLLDRADLLIVPCTHNKRVFSNATQTPIEICPGGVNASLYPYRRREFNGKLFTFLFIGDHNPRKGTYHVAQAWELWNDRYPELSDKTQLIMKMTAYGKDQVLSRKTENAFLDYRVLPLTEKQSEDTHLPTLPALYDYAHAFLFTTMGEGWGLPLCEAMASGLPCVYTPYGGPEDTACETYGYPVEYKMKTVGIKYPGGGSLDPVAGASPIIESIVDNMHDIYLNYDQALEKGRIAAWMMRECCGWDRAADAFTDIIARNYPEVA